MSVLITKIQFMTEKGGVGAGTDQGRQGQESSVPESSSS